MLRSKPNRAASLPHATISACGGLRRRASLARAGGAQYRGVFAILTVLGVLCACNHGDGKRPTNDDAGGCVVDRDCATGFCNRGECVEPSEGSPLGQECTVPRDPYTGEPQYRFSACQAYLCLDGKCRSCQSDSECNARGGDVQVSCRAAEGRPGMACGRDAPSSEIEQAPPPDGGDTQLPGAP